jgi:hypothetical protein
MNPFASIGLGLLAGTLAGCMETVPPPPPKNKPADARPAPAGAAQPADSARPAPAAPHQDGGGPPAGKADVIPRPE